MPEYQTAMDYWRSGQASAIANALNALKLQDARTADAGGGVAGAALLSALAQQGAPPSPTPAPGQASQPMQSPSTAAPQGMPGQGNIQIPQVSASQVNPPSTPPVTGMRSPLPAPPTPGSFGAATPPAAAPSPASPAPSAGAPPQGITWQQIAQKLKEQNPNIDPKTAMAAIDRLTPVMAAQSKQEWDQFKLQLQTQVKEQGMQNQLDIANMRNATAQRGQNMRYGDVSAEDLGPLVNNYKQFGMPALASQPPAIKRAVQALAEAQGFTAKDLENNLAGNRGLQAQATATGRQLGPLEVAGGGFQEIAPKAIEASNKIDRDTWKAAAQAENWLYTQSNDPDFVAFQDYNIGLVREYARAMGGTVAAQKIAQDALGTAKSPEAYDRAVKTLQDEITRATKGGKNALENVGKPATEPDAGISVGGPAPGAIEDGYRFKGGDPGDPKNWELARGQ